MKNKELFELESAITHLESAVLGAVYDIDTNDIESRLRAGKDLEDMCFDVLQCVNDIPHTSDKVIWIYNKPLFVEIKQSLNIEWECLQDQKRILDNGYPVIIIAINRTSIKKNANINTPIVADWLQNIETTDKIEGVGGSKNDFAVMKMNKPLLTLLDEIYRLKK